MFTVAVVALSTDGTLPDSRLSDMLRDVDGGSNESTSVPVSLLNDRSTLANLCICIDTGMSPSVVIVVMVMIMMRATSEYIYRVMVTCETIPCYSQSANRAALGYVRQGTCQPIPC